MTIEITIQVPDRLERQIQRFRERLPEVLERGLRDVMAEQSARFQDEDDILAVLASGPTPEQVLSLHPSPDLQARASELLARSKTNELSRQEESELDRYLTLEHLVRLAKGHAYHQLATHS